MSVTEAGDGARSSARGGRPEWEARTEMALPRSSYEELEIRASDGAPLRAVVDDPPPGVPFAGTLLLAHAIFGRKSSFGERDQPGLSSDLAARGFRTVAFDFRGHGDSALAGSPSSGYDDLVRRDLPAVFDCARARGEGKPVLVVGHSLGGTVALAAQGTGRIAADALVAVGANVWLRAFEPSLARWAAKRTIASAILSLSARRAATRKGFGEAIARSLRLDLPLRWGADDTAAQYAVDLFRGVTQGSWSSTDGRDDYLAGLARVDVPVAAVLGDRDRVMCDPESGAAFAQRCGGPVALFGAPASHRQLVREACSRRVVIDAVAWAVGAAARQARP